MKRILFAAFSILAAADVGAACNPALPTTLEAQYFTMDAAGLVTDQRTGLTWMRCSLGQQWDSASETCSSADGELTLAWQDALQAADTHRFAGFSDWRLPNRKELASLVEFQCYGPAADADLFPNTAPARYWTSTPFPGSSPLSGWFVDFTDGSFGNSRSTDLYQVRLVRGGE